MKKAFWMFLLFQLVFLFSMVGMQMYTEHFGKEIRLKTSPIDPTDLFYGDYVTLHYEISNLSTDLWKEETPFPKQTNSAKHDEANEPPSKLYVLLEEKGRYYEPIGLYADKPSVGENQILLKAKYRFHNTADSIRVIYGLERYYVEENTGKRIETSREEWDAMVKVSPFGQQISRLVSR